MASADLIKPHPEASIEDTLASLTPRVKRLLRSSFGTLTGFDDGKRAQIAKRTIAAVTAPGYSFDETEFAVEFNVTPDQAAHIANGVTFLSALVSGFGDLTTDVLLDHLVVGELLGEDDKPGLVGWLDFLRSNTEMFVAELETSKVVNVVLPSLSKFELAVDIRLAENVSHKPQAVPVVVGVLDTDAEGQIVWFQMSKAQLVRMQSQLSSLLKQVEHAEAMIDRMKAPGQAV